MEVDKEPVMRPSSTSAYLLDNARRETSKRFDALSVLYDGDTIRHLENRGVSEGWSCLEVGGGRRLDRCVAGRAFASASSPFCDSTLAKSL
jgi:hypothetical protein